MRMGDLGRTFFISIYRINWHFRSRSLAPIGVVWVWGTRF